MRCPYETTFLSSLLGSYFWVSYSHASSHKATVPLCMCIVYCLYHLAFWNLKIPWVCNFGALLHIKIFCSSTEQNTLSHSSTYSSCLLPFSNSEAWFLFLTTSRWFAVRLDAICAMFVIIVAFGSLILAKSKYRCE